MRIYFVTDVHGSEVTFRKFLNSYPVYEPDIMIIGGDITGKVMIPLVPDGEGVRATTPHGEVKVSADDVSAYERQIADAGSYTWHCSQDEFDRAAGDADYREKVFRGVMVKRVEEWMRLAEDRLGDKPVRVFISGGNDDYWEVDEPLKASSFVECPDNRVVALGEGVSMLSLGLANETPWQCPRDVSEQDLAGALDALTDGHDPVAVFNLHVPPYDSGLDFGPLLDENQKPSLGIAGMEQTPVGSHAIRKKIEDSQPALSLHGHVHESRCATHIGNTIALNPGSEYGQGILRGALIDLEGPDVKLHQWTSG